MLKNLGYTTLQLGMRHYADAEDANLLGFDAANYRWQDVEAVRAGKGPTTETDVFRTAVAERLDERLGQLFGLRHAIDGFAHVEGRRESPYWSDERRVATLTRYFPAAPEPWFVHAHLLDTHCCAYQPVHSFFPRGPNSADDARDNQIRESDGQLRRLFEALQADGKLNRTVVVVYSDHTARWTTTERVPLMIRFPDARVRGRISVNAQLADVAPTVLDYLGIEIPAWMDGQSMLHEHQLDVERPIFGLSDIADRQAFAPLLSVLSKAGPPNYGAESATMVARNQWFELNLLHGSLSGGPVAGHTRRYPAVIPETKARDLLLSKLAAAGFLVEMGVQARANTSREAR